MKFILIWLFSFPIFAISALEDGQVYYQDDKGFIIITKNNSQNYFPDLEWLEQKNSYPPLVIRFMAEEVGHGVFAGRDIKKGEEVFSYEGVFSQDADQVSGLYVLGIMSDNKLYTVDAGKKGNVGRFVQHTPNNLDKYSVKDPEKIAVSNIQIIIKWGKKISFIAYAIKDIRNGEMIGFDYGELYWRNQCLENNKSFVLFTKTGEIYPNYVTIFLKIYIISPVDEQNCVEWEGPLNTLVYLMIPNEYIKFGPENDMLVVSREQISEILHSQAPVSHIIALHSCAECLKAGGGLMKCGACEKIEYCSRDCQVKHWRSFHRNNCKK